MKLRKGSKITIPRKAGYPNIKVKVLDYTDTEVTVQWGINKLTIKRKYL